MPVIHRPSVPVAFINILCLPLFRLLHQLFQSRRTICRLKNKGLVAYPGIVSMTSKFLANPHSAHAAMESSNRTSIVIKEAPRLYHTVSSTRDWRAPNSPSATTPAIGSPQTDSSSRRTRKLSIGIQPPRTAPTIPLKALTRCARGTHYIPSREHGGPLSMGSGIAMGRSWRCWRRR